MNKLPGMGNIEGYPGPPGQPKWRIHLERDGKEDIEIVRSRTPQGAISIAEEVRLGWKVMQAVPMDKPR